jgi:cyclase
VIALVDYGAGNLTSVRKALAAVGAEVYTPAHPFELSRADGIIVPGVGHFSATEALGADWRQAIRSQLEDGRPLLGICVGLQWLFDGSTEARTALGFGACPGHCTRLPDVDATGARQKVPHVGWNALRFPRKSRLFAGVPDGSQVYFTHSYAAPIVPQTAAISTYGVSFSAAVEHGLVSGVQFHPEKSGAVGLQVLRNWLHMVYSPARVELAQWEHRTTSVRVPLGHAHPERPAGRLSKRIIACLDVRDGKVVKGVNFEGLREAGDPAALARRYDAEGIDEIVILDVTATLEARQARAHTIQQVAKEIFLPLCVGGGIRTEADAAAAIEAGADKVSLNTAALEHPELITTLARRYGSQAVVVAVDAKLQDGRFAVYVRSGSSGTARDAVEWAREAAGRGAGEILLTSIDKDGTKSGFDCAMTAAVSDAVAIPVIASGGAGDFDHFADVFTFGRADAALAASIFHFNEHSVEGLKQYLAARGIPVRP